MIIRFDDTNPSKEKEEYAENIIQDLATLGVKPDIVTHTSDSFAKCEEVRFSHVSIFYMRRIVLFCFFSDFLVIFVIFEIPKSDIFVSFFQLARRMIIEEKAYMDDTDQETMQVKS